MQLPIQIDPKGIGDDAEDHDEGYGAADAPEIRLVLVRVDDALEVHAEVGGEEGEGEKDDGYACEEEDGFVLAVCYDGHFVLFDGAELEELRECVLMMISK